MNTGYSGTPLARKLGYCGPVWVRDMPDDVSAEIGTPDGGWLDGPDGAQAAHLFHTRRDDLAADLARARADLPDSAMVWVSWPKKASRVPTDVTEDVVRAEALPLGFVDVKVCAVDPVWSALKLVVRKALRVTPAAAVITIALASLPSAQAGTVFCGAGYKTVRSVSLPSIKMAGDDMLANTNPAKRTARHLLVAQSRPTTTATHKLL